MPERVDGLKRRRQNVFYELASRSRQLLLGHDLILAKVVLVPMPQRLYNQGIHVPDWIQGTDGPEVASQQVGSAQ